MRCTRNEPSQPPSGQKRKSYHEHNLISIGSNTGDTPDCVKELILKRGHTLIKHDMLQETHQNNLRIALSTVSRLGQVLLRGASSLDNQAHGDTLLELLVRDR